MAPVGESWYSGAKKYLVRDQLCKFSHLEKKNDIVGFLMNLFAKYGGK
jgi:hypothetical protein